MSALKMKMPIGGAVRAERIVFYSVLWMLIFPRFLGVSIFGFNLDMPKALSIVYGGVFAYILIKKKCFRFILDSGVLIFLLLSMMLFYSVYISHDQTKSLVYFASDFLTVYALFYYGYLSDQSFIVSRRFRRFVAMLTLYSSVYIIAEYVFGYNFFTQLTYKVSNVSVGESFLALQKSFGLSASGWFGISLDAGQIMFQLAFINLIYYKYSGKDLYIWLVFISLIALFLTQSRSALIVTLIGVFWILFSRVNLFDRRFSLDAISRRFFKLLIISGTLFVSSYFIFTTVLGELIHQTFVDEAQTSLANRLYGIGLSVSLLAENWMGHGYGVLTKISLADAPIHEFIDRRLDFAYVLGVALESGLLAMILYVGFIFVIVRHAFRVYCYERSEYAYVVFVYLALFPLLHSTTMLLYPLALYLFITGNYLRHHISQLNITQRPSSTRIWGMSS